MRRTREGRPDAVVALDAHDLLDQIDLGLEVRPVAGDLDLDAILARRGRHAEDVEHVHGIVGRARGSRGAPWRATVASRPTERDGAPPASATPDRTLPPVQSAISLAPRAADRPDTLRIGAAFEPVRSLRVQPEPAPREQHAAAREVRALEQDVGGVGRDLGGPPSHDAADGDRRLDVADQQIVRGERSLDIVERRQALPVVGVPHDDPWAREPVHVEAMERLSQLEHGVVGGVDHRVDRPHPARRESGLREERRRSMRHAADHPCQVPGTAVGSLDGHRGHIGRSLRCLDRHGIGLHDVRPGGGCHLSGHTEHGEEVGPVRLDLDVQDGLVQLQRRLDVGADLPPFVVEQEDPPVVVADRELARRAQHAVGVDAPEGPHAEGLGQDRHP